MKEVHERIANFELKVAWFNSSRNVNPHPKAVIPFFDSLFFLSSVRGGKVSISGTTNTWVVRTL
jgi:hypothetical protein